MKRTSLMVAGFSAMVALGLIGYGCTSGDTVKDGTGGKGTGGSTTTTGTGGSTTTTGTGGSTTTGTGGSTTTGTGGATGGIPTCVPAPADKSTCDPAMVTTPIVSPCTKNCGIKAEATQPRAQKPCTCLSPGLTWDCTNAGACVYPPTFNKTCFALTPAPPACSTAPMPTSGMTACVNTAGATCGPLCGSASAMSYLDSGGKMHAGYCACINAVWQCASVAEWPM